MPWKIGLRFHLLFTSRPDDVDLYSVKSIDRQQPVWGPLCPYPTCETLGPSRWNWVLWIKSRVAASTFSWGNRGAQCPWDCPDPCDLFIAPFHAWHTRSRRVIQVTPQSPDVLSLEETEHMFHDRIIVAPPTHLAKPGLSVVGFPVPSRPLSHHPVPALSTEPRALPP